MIRETLVPSIPDIRDDNVKDVLRAIKSTLDVREGNIGDPLDQVVTMRELSALNLVDKSSTSTTSYGATLPVGPVIPAPTGGYNPATDYTIPPAPTNLRARGGFTNVYLEWDGAPIKNLAYTEIWRSAADSLGTAVMVGTTAANVYADAAAPDTEYFYWVRFVSEANVTGPYNGTSGTRARTAMDVSAAISAISDEIINSQLYADLGSRISATETGIKTLTDITATSAKSVSTLASVVNGHSAAIEVAQSSVDGLRAQYSVKIDNNGHVSGFGLSSTITNGKPMSAFIVRADRFAIVGANSTTDPLGTLTPSKVPFIVLTTPTVIGGKTYPAGTWIDTAFIANATIANAQISDLTADKITTGSLTASIGITTGKITGGVNTAYAFGSSNFGTGFYLGSDSGVYKFRVGSYAKNMTWDGTNLSVTGTVSATGATFQGLTITDASGNVLLSSGGGVNGAYVSGLGAFAGLDEITSTNISTYIADGAIGNAHIGNFISSTNFNGVINSSGLITSNGTTGWAIGKAGNAVFQSIYARGDIQASSLNAATGTFSGTLTSSAINAVNTINVAGNAVTAMYYAAGGSGTLAANEQLKLITSVSISMPTGSSGVVINAFVNMSGYYSGTTVYIEIKRNDGTQLRGVGVSLVSGFYSSFAITAFDPYPTSTYPTYAMYISNPTTGPGSNSPADYSDPSIQATGGKR
jgi:hypothetical protein